MPDDVIFQTHATEGAETLHALDPFVFGVAGIDIDGGLDPICITVEAFVVGAAVVVEVLPPVLTTLAVIGELFRQSRRSFVVRRWSDSFSELASAPFWIARNDVA